MPKCTAKAKSTGKQCGVNAMPNGKCYRHGGASTGAPKNNLNAASPGSIYSKFLSPEEQALERQIKIGSIDDELRLTRVLLARCLSSIKDEPELDVIVERDGAENVTARREEHYKRTDYYARTNMLTARIESLEKSRTRLLLDNKELEKDDPSSNGVDGFEIVEYDD